MKLFTIHCTTCQAKLKVRDASAIGQIFACPKCGSMVLVQMPSTASASPAPPAASGTQDTIIDESLYDEFVNQHDSHSSSSIGSASSTELSECRPYSHPIGAENTIAASDAASASETPVDDAPTVADALSAPIPEPPLPTANWHSASTQQWRQWLALGGAAIGGVALAIGLFGYFISRGGKPPSGETVATVADESPKDPIENDTPDLDETSPVEPEAVDESDSSASEPKPSAADETVDESANDPPPPIVDPPADDVATVDTDGPPDLVPRDTIDDKDAAPLTTDAVKPLPDRVASATPRIDFSALTNPTTAATIDSAADSTSVESAPDSTAPPPEESPRERPAVQPVNVAARLADPIASIQFDGTPLADFLRFVSDLSTIPITIDTASLARLGVSADSPIVINKTDTNVAGILAAALEPLRLGYEATNGQLIVAASDESAPRKVQRFDAADLAKDSASLQSLAELAKRFVAPGTWRSGHGALTIDTKTNQLVVEHDAATRFEAGLFLERLRLARGITPRGQYSPSLMTLTPPRQQADAALSTVVMANFGRPTRLTRILDYLGERTKTRILVDWRSLADLGWTPSTQTSVVIQNETLDEALQKLLTPLDMTYRVVSERTIVVTSRIADADHFSIEFIKVNKPANLDAGKQQIAKCQAALGDHLFAESGSRAVIEFDPASSYLIARLPNLQQQMLRQIIAE